MRKVDKIIRKLDKIIDDIYKKIDYLFQEVEENKRYVAKLVEQGNQITSVLKDMQEADEDLVDLLESELLLTDYIIIDKKADREIYIKEMVDNLLDKQKNLKELEKILEKYKDQIIIGQIGES